MIIRCIGLFLAASLTVAPTKAQTADFLGHELTWVSPDTLVRAFDGTPNFSVRVVNKGATPTPDGLFFRFASPDYPNPGGGFATFPNGGYIKLAPAETTWVQTWSAGIYEHPAPTGFFERTIQFQFVLDQGPGQQQEFVFSRQVTFENHGRPAPPSSFDGPMVVSGRVRNGQGMVRAEIRTPFSDPLNLTLQSQPDGSYAFQASVRERSDWLLVVHADQSSQQILPLTPGQTENLDITLAPMPTDVPRYDLSRVIETPSGFWRGAVSESEGTFVAFPGQENWVRTGNAVTDSTLMASGRVQKYTFDGTLIWEHDPGWEIWGGDMSDDGRWVAYVLNPTFWNFRRPLSFRMVVLDGLTGEPVWTVDEQQGSPIGRLLESLELGMSPDGRFIAVGGTAGGKVGLFDREQQQLIWSIPEGQGYGQIRKLVFEGDHLYIGSGDDYLRKVRLSDGSPVWKAYIGGWPFVMGFDRAGDYIYTGTKSKHLTRIRDADGAVMWQRETQNLDAYADPSGQLVAGFGPQIMDAETGQVVGLAFLAVKHFLDGGEYFLTADKAVAVHARSGQVVHSAPPSGVSQGGGEQSQWSYLSEDERWVIILGRDMGSPPQPGIAIYERVVSSVSTEQDPVLPDVLSLDAVYPNPFSGRLRLEWSTRQPGNTDISIHDILGRLVDPHTLDQGSSGRGSAVLDLRHLAPGMYLVEVRQGAHRARRTVVKAR